AGGAVVVTSAERARDCAKRPVYVLGAGEASTHVMVSQMPDFARWEAARMAGERAFAMAGVTPADIDVAQVYDAFTIVPIMALEALGFCKEGEGGAFVSGQRTAPGGSFPMNTNGGEPQATPELLKLTRGRRIVPVVVREGRIEIAPEGGSSF